jgi:hypothetical protein
MIPVVTTGGAALPPVTKRLLCLLVNITTGWHYPRKKDSSGLDCLKRKKEIRWRFSPSMLVSLTKRAQCQGHIGGDPFLLRVPLSVFSAFLFPSFPVTSPSSIRRRRTVADWQLTRLNPTRQRAAGRRLPSHPMYGSGPLRSR